MRALIQRVTEASVTVDGEIVGAINHGLLALVGVTHDDGASQAKKLAEKIAHLRIFQDDAQKMNLSVKDIGGSVLVVSQFTLYGDTSSGRRPSWTMAAKGDVAEPLVQVVLDELAELEVPTAQGRFGADMKVRLLNDGPVTLWVEV